MNSSAGPVPPLIKWAAIVFLLAIAFSEINHRLSTRDAKIKTLITENRRIIQYARQFGHLSYLASDYGEDLRHNPSKRFVHLDQFTLPIADRPLLIQADDVVIQVYRDTDSLRVTAFRVKADTTAGDSLFDLPGVN